MARGRRTRPLGRASLARKKRESIDQYLARLYYTPDSPSSFGGAQALLRTVKLANAAAPMTDLGRIRFKDVQNFLAKQRTYVLYKQRRTKFPHNKSLPIPGPGYLFSIDIWDLRKFSKKKRLAQTQQKAGRSRRRKAATSVGSSPTPPNYVLVGIDNFSKRIAAVPMPDKTQESVVEALNSILNAGFRFRILRSDNDRAFTGGKTQQFLEKNGSVHYTSRTDQHCYAAERAIGVLAKKLRRMLYYQRTFDWVRPLAQVVSSYNATPHSALVKGKFSPNQVTVRNSPKIYRYMYVDPKGARRKVKPTTPRFQVGDKVLLSRPAQPFRKGYESSFYPERYTVHKIHTKGRERPVYNLIDAYGKVIKGRYYNEQLQKYIGR